MGFAVFVGRQQATIFPQGYTQKIDRALGGLNPGRILENHAGAGHTFDHQAIPTGEDFFIAAGMNALFAHGKQLGARRVQALACNLFGDAQVTRHFAQRLDDV